MAGSERRELSPREAARIAARLRAKYVEILALRDLHAAGEDPPDVRHRLRALARGYPGALRELDRLVREDVTARVASLERVLSGAPLEPWMIATDRVHRWLRVALLRRSILRGRAVGGRIVPAVHALVARELGLSVSELADLVELRSRPPA